MVVGGSKPVNGVTLPEKLYVKWNGQPFAEWVVTRVEFPATHDPKLFDGP